MQADEAARRINSSPHRLRPSANQTHRLAARLPEVSLWIAVNCPPTSIRAIGPTFGSDPVVIAVIQHGFRFRNSYVQEIAHRYSWTCRDSFSDVDSPSTLLMAVAGVRSVGLSVVP
jgi:hypothetical protein